MPEIDDIKVDKTESSFCSGWRFKEDCSHTRKFYFDGKYCTECNEDTMKEGNDDGV